MLFDFFKKQTEKNKKIRLLKSVLEKIKIPENQKRLYLESLDILENEELDKLYDNIMRFIKKVEDENLKKIYKNNFSSIKGVSNSKEQEELNSVNFLLNNI